MFPNNNDGLDPIALWVLLILSGGQRFTARELAEVPGRPAGNLWDALQDLLRQQFIRSEKGRFMIASAGVEFLALRGVISAEPEDEPQPKDFIKKIRPPFFSSFPEFFTWAAAPLLLLLLTIMAASVITAGFNFISPDKKAAQYGVWILYFVIAGLYVWGSHHNIMEHERLVIFRGGKAIAKKGPGHAFILPLIDNPKKVDLREKSQEIKKEPCLTQDNILVNAGFYISWHIDDPIPSLTKVSNVEDSMSLLCAAILRATISEYSLRNALRMQKAINTLIRTRIEQRSADWGVEVNNTEVRELHPPDNVMKRIENQLSATLESDATRIKSDAHARSLRDYLTIGEGMARNPIAFNLKYLDTLEKIGEGPSTKYIIPMEFFTMLQEFLQGMNNRDDNNPGNGNNPPRQLPGGPAQ